jgi:hypothetical protein
VNARRSNTLIFVGLAAVLVAAAVMSNPDHGPVLCAFRAITSLPCPSCGMTRAFHALSHGDLRAATAFNLASPFVYAAAWLGLVLAFAGICSDEQLIARAWRKSKYVVAPLTIGLMAAAWIHNLVVRFSA